VSLSREYFDELYARDSDPWSFRVRPYETRKRLLTVACLPDAHYRSVFEPGCSFGLLTTLLAENAETVLAMDISEHALAQARQAAPNNVEFRRGSVPDDWPDGTFDLVVLSEIGYYLCAQDCVRLADRAVIASKDLVAVHWRRPVTEYPLTGDQVHTIIAESAVRHGRARIVQHVEADLRIDVWSADGRSVAIRTGV
jgi:SAM-dependent methyltransferase